jgi:sulfite exporter TauE/SafE
VRGSGPGVACLSVTYAIVFVGGLFGSLHCVGMCGGFPLALAAGRTAGNLPRQLLYNLGRLNTLAAIGALSGAAGVAVVASGPVWLVGRVLALAAGLFMIAVGLEMLGFLAGISARGAAMVQRSLGRLLGSVIRSRSPAAPLALGVFNAFLPCQLIYAFAAQAASTASVGRGTLTMLAFGLGTLPAMLAVGTTRALMGVRVRARLSLLSGLLVIAFGTLTMLRGFDVLPHAGHAHGVRPLNAPAPREPTAPR